MKKKLTLTIDESVRDRAKKFAKNHGLSISYIVERYLDEVTKDDTGFTPEDGSWTDQLLGAVSVPAEEEHLDYKEIKERELLKKHGR